VSSNSHRSHDTKAGTTTTAESPVKVTVLGGRGTDNTTSSSDNLKLEGVISTKAVARAERRVATTQSKASKAYSGTLTRNTSKSLRVGILNTIKALNTSTKLESGAVVKLVSPLNDFSVLEMMSPDSKAASTSRSTKVAKGDKVNKVIKLKSRVKLTRELCFGRLAGCCSSLRTERRQLLGEHPRP
jgi:hypothetical protein